MTLPRTTDSLKQDLEDRELRWAHMLGEARDHLEKAQAQVERVVVEFQAVLKASEGS